MTGTIVEAFDTDTNEEWHLHASTCNDLNQPKYRRAEKTTNQTMETWIDDEMTEMGWGPEHVKVFPCYSNQ